eukprot:gene10849-biopygen21346
MARAWRGHVLFPLGHVFGAALDPIRPGTRPSRPLGHFSPAQRLTPSCALELSRSIISQGWLSTPRFVVLPCQEIPSYLALGSLEDSMSSATYRRRGNEGKRRLALERAPGLMASTSSQRSG